jgi:hypothetical protein
MRLTDKNILLVSPEPWNHIFVSKHHYAVHLAQHGNSVFFLNPPSGTNAVDATEWEDLYSIDYRGFIRGLRFLPRFVQKKMIRNKFEFLQAKAGVKFDIIWSFDNSVFFDLSALPSTLLKISHIVDLNQDFQTDKSASTADLCLCTTDFIRERLLKYNAHVFKINHGFNDRHLTPSHLTLPGKAKVKGIYAGNLAMPYIDWIIILDTVKNNPEVDFVFLGPNKDVFNQNKKNDEAKREVLRLNNVRCLGSLPSGELLHYEAQADVLFLAYQEEYHRDQANPHKMMEYLGSGKMIVATFTAEYKELCDRGLFLMSKDNRQLTGLFKEALNNLGYWNSIQKQELRRDFAYTNTYDKQIERIERILSNESEM